VKAVADTTDKQPQQIGRPEHWHPNRKRPSIYEEGVLERFIDKLASTAQSIKTICEPDDMPRSVEVFIAMGRDPAVRARIAQAREAQQDVIIDELLDIADTATVEEVNLAKLRIWTRQWAAARFAPKKYGENQRVEVTHTLSQTAAQVLQDLSQRAHARRAIEAQCIDVTPAPSLCEGAPTQQDQRVAINHTHSAPAERAAGREPPAPATTIDPPRRERPPRSTQPPEKNTKRRKK
jgi:hypothetical protein